MKRAHLTFFALVLGFVLFFISHTVWAADNSLLSPQESLWLSTRNNTIVVYPEKNDPPFSYQTASGAIEGLSIDYFELIAEKIGAKIEYLTPRSRSQIYSDVQEGKGDVFFSFTAESGSENAPFLFTEPIATVPVVIVVRKDATVKKTLTLGDFSGKRVALVASSATEDYVRKNYPRVVVESVTDDEVGLQQVVLGEVDATLMDVASLSYLLSKQVLTSVKVGGDVGLDYELSFGVTKEKEALQAILEKGLSQVSANDRALLADKWILVPGKDEAKQGFFEALQEHLGVVFVYGILGLGFIGLLVLLFRRRHFPFHYFKRRQKIESLQEEMAALEDANKTLSDELHQVQEMEQKIAQKINEIRQ